MMAPTTFLSDFWIACRGLKVSFLLLYPFLISKTKFVGGGEQHILLQGGMTAGQAYIVFASTQGMTNGWSMMGVSSQLRDKISLLICISR
jgi:hypothetical protein